MEISKIKVLAKELNLNNIANLPLDEFSSDLPNVDYLEYMLLTELRMRKEKNVIKQRKLSRLPRTAFMQKYNGITHWQLNELKKLAWITEEQNLVVIGNCGVGKRLLLVCLERKSCQKAIKSFMQLATIY